MILGEKSIKKEKCHYVISCYRFENNKKLKKTTFKWTQCSTCFHRILYSNMLYRCQKINTTSTIWGGEIFICFVVEENDQCIIISNIRLCTRTQILRRYTRYFKAYTFTPLPHTKHVNHASLYKLVQYIGKKLSGFVMNIKRSCPVQSNDKFELFLLYNSNDVSNNDSDVIFNLVLIYFLLYIIQVEFVLKAI